MRVTTGTRIGPYEVVALVGAGGMGQVYRGRDVRLQRDVAIKFLHDSTELDAVRKERFEREARLLASLNNPHIATVYGIENSAAGQALVMEFVEGHTLSDHMGLSRNTGAIRVRETLLIASQIAAALETAHTHGVIHRDLKPANILVRSDGTVKVLDFGLAQSLDTARTPVDGSTISLATLEERRAGTPAYMSPEQVRGLPLDKRSDIWAFGCVLYELLSGKRPFPADSTTEITAKILEAEPDLSLLPAATSSSIRRLVRRCLEKDPQERLRDIGDALLEIDEALKSPTAGATAKADQKRWWWSLAGALSLIIGVGALAYGPFTAKRNSAPVVRYSFPVEVGRFAGGRSLAISPDGSRLAYLSRNGLTVRSRDSLDEQLLDVRGSGPQAPFFSPDGEWIGYVNGVMLFKVPVNGGPPVPIADVGPGAVGSWNREGIICAGVNGIFRFAHGAGKPQKIPMQPLDSLEQPAYPELLPGGRAALLTILPTRTNLIGQAKAASETARIEVLNTETGRRKTIVLGASRGHLTPTGDLLYVSNGGLYAARFDSTRQEIMGTPALVLANLPSHEYAVADDGTLSYLSGEDLFLSSLVWVDRRGHEEKIEAPPHRYIYPRLSPDGSRVALDATITDDRDIWIWDLHRRVLERFTVDPAGNPLAAWSPDGKMIAFGSERFGPSNLFIQPSDRSAEPKRLLDADHLQIPINFAPDGRLLFSEEVPNHGRDIQVLSLDGSKRVESLVHSPGQDVNAEISPDGRWIAYDSEESGQFEVYVRKYGKPDEARWQISVGGGRQPLWSRDGRELFYRDFSGAIWGLRVSPGEPFSSSPASKIMEGGKYIGDGRYMSARTYDVSLDGRQFLMLKPLPPTSSRSIVVVLNWFTELERALPH